MQGKCLWGWGGWCWAFAKRNKESGYKFLGEQNQGQGCLINHPIEQDKNHGGLFAGCFWWQNCSWLKLGFLDTEYTNEAGVVNWLRVFETAWQIDKWELLAAVYWLSYEYCNEATWFDRQ